jgi:cytochrome P450
MSQSPPGSLGAPFIGEALQFLKDPFTFTLSRTKQHGPIWKTRILGDTVVFFTGPKPFAFFMNPENFTRENGSPKFLQELLHPDAVPFLDGERHRTRKRLLLSAFADPALDSYLPGMLRIFERFVETWLGTELAVGPDLNQLGFDIADMLFAGASPESSNVERCADFATMNRGTFAPPVNLPFTAYGKAIKARDRLRGYIKEAVASRDGGALGVLKRARGPNGEQLPANELEIELLHFYFAAHGGLTAAIAWLLVVLGEHPDIARSVRTEADANFGDGTLAQVRKLALARAVSREVLRAYPIAPTTFIGVAKRDLELDGFAIQKGWKGAGAVWATMQDATTFRDPTLFKSDRLTDTALRALPEGSFVPQGGGPPDGHRCAGEALIQMAMPTFLGWFTRRYDLTWPPQDASPGAGGLGPLPKSGVRVKITKRA